jgi:SAM-dependent methyltransferase
MHTVHRAAPQRIPLKPGDPADFARVRTLCQEAGFTEEQLCQALALESLADLPKFGQHQRDLMCAATEPLVVLIRLFLLGMPVPREQVERAAAGPAGLAALERLNLVRPYATATEGGACLATVCLYPVAGLLIASDPIFNPDGTHYSPPSDLVFAAISPGTLQFLRVISLAPARAVLDLCTGSGVAALLLSQTADQATAVDITARSAHFARFNALLNDCRNVAVVQGDLYRDLGDQRFDRIVAHPPYAPALADPQTWRDGGATGEAVLQGIVEGLPDRLMAGGSFYAVTMGLDIGPHSFEDRIRLWLGDSQAEFDLIFAVDRDWMPRQLAADLAVRSENGEAALIHRWEEHLRGLGVRRASYGALAIRRREAGQTPVPQRAATPAGPLTLRTRLSGATDGEAFARTFERHQWLSSPDAGRELAAAAPRLSPHLQVKVTHGVQEGNLVPMEFLLETDRPFRSGLRLEPWMLPVIARCDGSRNTAELYREAQTSSAMPADFGLNDFAGLIALLVYKGCLEVGGKFQ